MERGNLRSHSDVLPAVMAIPLMPVIAAIVANGDQATDRRELPPRTCESDAAGPTPAERTAWELLRNRRCLGLKFRRQHVISGFIVDFYCAELRLAVEVDGLIHEDQRQRWRDEARTAALNGVGVRVVRICNDELSSARLVELLRAFTQDLTGRSPLSMI
jgi:very-short-patch-repair endonuclease